MQYLNEYCKEKGRSSLPDGGWEIANKGGGILEAMWRTMVVIAGLILTVGYDGCDGCDGCGRGTYDGWDLDLLDLTATERFQVGKRENQEKGKNREKEALYKN